MSEVLRLHALLRADLRYFVHKAFQTVFPGTPYLHNWHIDAIVHELMEVHSGATRRLLINQPPRSLKSLTISVAYVAWRLGHDPSERIIVASYSSDFAAELHRQFRLVIDAKWYRDTFPKMRVTRDTGTECITSQGGGRYATSVGGTLTGRGADLIVTDDPLKAEEASSEPARRRVLDWYSGTLITRLNNKDTDPLIIVIQRLHEDDLAGHVLRHGEWRHLNLPAIATEDELILLGRGRTHQRRRGDLLHPERESRAALDRLKVELGSLTFSAQYQQQPIPLEGNLIRRCWFRDYERLPTGSSSSAIVQSWDVAMMTGMSNDYSVCTTWQIAGSEYYLIDVFRGRLQYPDLRRKVVELATKYKVDTILIENVGPGMSLLQDLRRDAPNGMPLPIGRKPDGSKVERMVAQSAKIEAGHVLLPAEAPWRNELLLELLAFPNGKHDDQVDSVSQFLGWAALRLWDHSIPAPIQVGRGPRFDEDCAPYHW
jgi:predicted phage terminase large subunit-like protein